MEWAFLILVLCLITMSTQPRRQVYIKRGKAIIKTITVSKLGSSRSNNYEHTTSADKCTLSMVKLIETMTVSKYLVNRLCAECAK